MVFWPPFNRPVRRAAIKPTLIPGGEPRHRGRVADVLVVASAMRVLDRVHRHTAHLRPGVALHTVLVEVRSGLQDRLVETATAGHDPDRRAGARGNGAAGARGHADAGLLAVIGVADNDAGRAGGLRD